MDLPHPSTVWTLLYHVLRTHSHRQATRNRVCFPPLRYLFDLLLSWWMYSSTLNPVATFTLRVSLCQDGTYYEHPDGPEPISEAIRHDPWLVDYPCGPAADWGTQPTGLMLNVKGTSFQMFQDPAPLHWMRHNWVWATAYIIVRYNFWQGGFMVLLLPACIFLPLLAPGWWYRSGGRTACMVSVRVLTLLMPGLLSSYDRHVQRVHVLDALPPLRFGAAAVVKAGITTMVPYPIHVFVDILTTAACMLGMCARHQFNPPPRFIPRLLLGSVLGLAINAVMVGVLARHVILPVMDSWQVDIHGSFTAAVKWCRGVLWTLWTAAMAWLTDPAVGFILLYLCMSCLYQCWLQGALVMSPDIAAGRGCGSGA